MSTPSLARVTGVRGAVMLGLGSILGTGVFVSLGIAAGIAGSTVVLAVVLAALVATANGLSSAQLAAAHPVSGGTYAYARRYVHPVAGFAAGWMYLAAKSASAATAALGCVGYGLHLAGIDLGAGARVAVAVVVLLLLTLLVAGGLRRSSQVNALVVPFTLIALICFVVFGALNAAPGALDRITTWGNAGGLNLGHATALMFVAYTGYGRIATLGEEVRDPARTIPRAIIATLVVSAVLYLSVAATAVAVVGADAFAAATAQGAAPLETIARGFRQSWVAPVLAFGAVTAMIGVVLNLLLGLSRVVLAMAREGDLPRPLAHIDGESPRRAVWLVGAIIIGLALIGDVKTTWTFSAFTVLIYYGFTNLAALRLPPADRRFPRWISVAGLLCCFGLAFFVPWPVWVAGLGILAVGFGLRAVVRPRT